MYRKFIQDGQQRKRQNELLRRYGYFLLMLLCMILASIGPHLGRTNGVFSGNIIIRYFAVPLTYLEAGLLCDPKSLYLTLSNGYLLVFTMTFIYGLMPFLMRLGVCLLTYANVDIWLLKGMEVLYCMPPPFNTSLVLCRLAQADLSTSIVITLVSHFGGLFISPVLLYFVLGASTPPLVGVDVKETIYSTIIPLVVGIAIQSFILAKCDFCLKVKSPWFSQGLLLATAYHWFCDAISVDASSLQATDVLLCVLIGKLIAVNRIRSRVQAQRHSSRALRTQCCCTYWFYLNVPEQRYTRSPCRVRRYIGILYVQACVGQLFVSCLCWILCSRWLPRNVLVAALFTCTHKSVGLGSWVLRGAYHGSAHGPAVNLPLSVLPVAQLLLGSLLASWLSP